MKRTLLMMLLTTSIAGCGEDKQYDNVSAHEVETPAAPVEPTPAAQKPPHPWGNRDRNAPFQMVKFGETVIRVPTGYIHALHDRRVEKDGWVRDSSLILDAPLPELRDPKTVRKERVLRGDARSGYQGSRGSDYLQIVIDPSQSGYGQKYPVSEIDVLQKMFPTREIRFVRFDTKLDMRVYEYRLPGEAQFSPFQREFIPRKHRKPDGNFIAIGCDVHVNDADRGLCSYGFTLGDAGVRIRFPTKRLPMWQQIHQFVLDTVQINTKTNN